MDKATGHDVITLGTALPMIEAMAERAHWRIEKYRDTAAHQRGEVDQIVEFDGNLLLNEGIDELWTLVGGTGDTQFDNASAYIGVGDSSTAAAASQTGLQASSNKAYVAMDTSYPTYGSSQKATWRATFDASTGNFEWNEITVANGNSDSAKNLNRKVQAMGTKASPAVWVVSLEITLS